MLSTRYGDGVYSFAMNGQTGEVTGDLPIDKGKQTFWFCIPALVSFAVMIVLALILDYLSANVALVAFVVALLIGAIYVGGETRKMSAHEGTDASIYLLRDSVKITTKTDKHIRTYYKD